MQQRRQRPVTNLVTHVTSVTTQRSRSVCRKCPYTHAGCTRRLGGRVVRVWSWCTHLCIVSASGSLSELLTQAGDHCLV